MVYQPSLRTLVCEAGLTWAQWQVLMWLVSAAPLGHCIPLSQTAMAREVGLHPVTAHRTLHALIDRGFVVRDDELPSCYWVNPNLASLGDETDWRRLRERLGVSG